MIKLRSRTMKSDQCNMNYSMMNRLNEFILSKKNYVFNMIKYTFSNVYIKGPIVINLILNR